MRELHAIAARLAAASEVFPVKRPGEFASTAITAAEGDVLTVTVSDAKGGGRREYRAHIQLVSETTAPVNPGASTPGGSRREHPTSSKDVHR